MNRLLPGTNLVSLCAVTLMATAVTAAPPEDRAGRRAGGPEGRRDRTGQGMQGQGMQGRGMQGRGMRGQGIQAMPIIAVLDADGDGVLSAQEIENAAVRLKSLDKDGDGTLSAQEIMPRGRGRGMGRSTDQGGNPQRNGIRANGDGMGGRGKGPGKGRRGDAMQAGKKDGQRGPANMQRFFDNRDSDGDGKLTGDEIPERMRERLDRVDTDQDGSISSEEMQSAMAKIAQRGDKAGKGKGRGGDVKEAGTPGGERPKRPTAE